MVKSIKKLFSKREERLLADDRDRTRESLKGISEHPKFSLFSDEMKELVKNKMKNDDDALDSCISTLRILKECMRVGMEFERK